MSELRFDGRVTIVTGAGAGLGRQHALTLAARGAKVVVNDLGGGTSGGGHSVAAADQVVEEIIALGGEAVANYDSVEDGEKIVQTALDHFGTVDIVINNAGILRDVSFQKMSSQDWDLIMGVHLNGTKSVTQAAWPIMREKGYGRIVMTTSAAGIYGNFGQANYCAAKLGILGLANCLAVEGQGKGILVNTIAPIAASRLTASVMPEELLAALKPEAVSPLVAWLCHEECKETKGLFEVGAGYISKLRWERTLGHSFRMGQAFSLDDVASRWNKITDFTDAEHPSNTNEALAPIFNHINNPSKGGNEFIDLDVASRDSLVLESSYDERDLALYALGIGAAQDPLDSSELAYVYELGGNFQALPTFGVMPQSGAMLAAAKSGNMQLPGMNFGFDRLLHGEQYTEIKRPLPPHAKLKHTFKLKEAFDKDPNAVLTFAISSTDEHGEELIYNEMTAFVKGAGGWGGDRGPSGEINLPPDREPDAVIEERTDANQTLLYRLSGDWNPLHADPDFAKAFGFDKPILHGLCTFGFCGRHVIKAFCNNDGRYFKSIKVRFAKSVFPGDTLITRMWKESDTRILLETRVKERDEVVIKNAAVELYREIPKASGASKATPAAQAVADDRLAAADVFGVIGQYVAAHPELVANTQTLFQFNLTGPDSNWVLDLKNGKGECRVGSVDKPDVTLSFAEEHLRTVVTGSLAEVQNLYFGGQMKVGGNVMASNKLTVLQGIDPQRYEEAKAQRLGNPDAAGSTGEAPDSDRLTAADVFTVIGQYAAGHPELAEKTQTVFQFNLTEPDSQWVLDLKNGKGECRAGSVDKPDVTLSFAEEHLKTVVTGSLAEVQSLYFGGQMKVGGNVMASNKLTILQSIDPQQYEAAKAQRLTSGDKGATAAAAAVAPREAKAGEIFAALAKRLQTPDKALAELSGKSLQFNVSAPASRWIVDFSVTPASVHEGDGAAAPALTLGVSDADLLALVQGQRELRELYQHGDLRVEGDALLAHKLSFLNGLI